jgi:glucokinase
MVIEYNGRKCSCGRYGCFEAYSSATALVALTREKFAEKASPVIAEMCENDPAKIGGKTAFAAMRKGCKDSAEVVDYYIKHLACGIANLINIFQPNVLLIGGGVCNEGDPLLLPLRAEVAKQIYSADETLKTDIRIATLGNDAGIIGAAAIARKA